MLSLGEYRKRPALLADYLPWACLVAPGVVLNKDGSFQRSFRFRGPDLASAGEAELVAVTARVNNALRRFGSGWALFFEAARIPAGPYPDCEFPDPLSRLVDEERRAAFEEEGAHYESRYYATFLWLPPSDTVGRAELWLFERPQGGQAPSLRDHLARFVVETERALDLIAGFLPEAAFLGDEETLTYLHGCISERDHPIAVPEMPVYLDSVLADTALAGGVEPRLGSLHLRTLSVLGFPDATQPGLLDDLDHLAFSYRWMTRFIALDKAEATRMISRYRRQWFAKRKSVTAMLKEVMTSEASVLVDTDAGNKAADADAALEELGSDLAAYGYLTTTITVWDEDPAAAKDKLRAVERVLGRRGFAVIAESLNGVEAWLSSLPGQAYANVRQTPVSTLNLAHMMPLSAVWAGPARNAHLDGPPLLTARTEGSTPFRLSTHVGDVGHSLIVGPTGAGKSVLIALMALQFRRYPGAQITIFDKGGSARAATLCMGGRYYALGSGGSLAFQPLARIDGLGERAFARDWLAGLMAHEGVALTPEVKEALWSALTSLAGAPVGERTLTGLGALLQSSALRAALAPYSLDGPYGRLLDADEERLALGDVQCFEMETLMQERGAVLPVLGWLFHRLEAGFDGRPALMILDEAWLFLDEPAFAARIREWLKTLRKANVAVVFATQALADIAESSIAPAIIESCPTRIFLPNERAGEPQAREAYARFGLSERQIAIISEALPKRQYYLQSHAGNRLFELALGPVAQAVCAASSKGDHALIDKCLGAAGGEDFAAAWLRAKGLDWAGDLVCEMPFGAGENR